mmetsp:Transcript_41814/g.116620  ORF Transcript_41814/g.116620 Transcript_41814/m.116620 type:complete len:498 (-) Transcript_41814:77-1570(-)
MHPQGVAEDETPPVPVRPCADHGLNLVQPVAAPVGDEAKRLDDVCDVVQPPTALQVERVASAPLEQVHDVLATAPSHRQEGDVSDTKAAVADDRAVGAVLAGVHGVVLPRITKATLLKTLHHGVQDHAGRYWDEGLVRKPARQARAREVLAPGDQVNFLHAVLAASSDVLDGKGSITQDGCAATLEGVERNVVVHAVSNLAVEVLLTRVLDVAPCEVGARPLEHRRDLAMEGLLVCAQGLHREVVAAPEVLLRAHCVGLDHVATEVYVRQDAVSLGRVLQVRDDLVPLWPRLPISGKTQPVVAVVPRVAEPDVESSHLCLQLRGLVGLREPGVAAHAVVPIKHHEITALLVDPEERVLDAIVPRPQESDRVWPLHLLGLEAPEPSHKDLASDLGMVALDNPGAALLDDENQVLRVHLCLVANHVFHVLDLCADLHWQSDHLRAAVHLQRALGEAGAVVARPLGAEDVKAVLRHIHHYLLRLAPVLPQHPCRRRGPWP